MKNFFIFDKEYLIMKIANGTILFYFFFFILIEYRANFIDPFSDLNWLIYIYNDSSRQYF